jgi:CubicO group peptidase (beta-lactamase class C family)
VTTIDQLFSEAQGHVDSGAVPACQVAVGHRGRVVAFATFGAATDRTRFCIFSATKPMVASVIWLLLADGSIRPDDRIGTFIPELGEAGLGDVTLDQVLLHTCGFPNAPMPHLEGADAARRRARFATWSSEWEAGTRFEYHPSSAHWVLADLIDRLTGQDYRDVLEERICRPLGLPRVLGLAPDEQGDIAALTPTDAQAASDDTLRFNDADVRQAGNPGGGGFATAAQLALFYQGILHNPGGLWDEAVLHDATTTIRCTFDDPPLGVPANRTRGLVLAGDDGHHQLRYAIFGWHCSPASFGHAGAHAQVAWADPATGISFSYLSNALDADQMRAGIRANRLATIAADLDLDSLA